MTIAMPGSSDSLRRWLPVSGSVMTNLEKLRVEPMVPAWPFPSGQRIMKKLPPSTKQVLQASRNRRAIDLRRNRAPGDPRVQRHRQSILLSQIPRTISARDIIWKNPRIPSSQTGQSLEGRQPVEAGGIALETQKVGNQSL